MADYKQVKDPITNQVKIVLRVVDNAYIPLVVGNADYAQYQAWLALGNTPDPA